MYIESMRLSLGLLMLVTLAGCAYRASDERAPIEPQGIVALEREVEPRNELILRALGMVGVPYRFGGRSPDTGFDCSGLVHYLYGEVLGIALPRRAQDMSQIGETVRRQDLTPGDLVFFDTLREPYSHVGIYLGKDRFIHAPSNGGRVEIVTLTNRYWHRRYNGARRVAY